MPRSWRSRRSAPGSWRRWKKACSEHPRPGSGQPGALAGGLDAFRRLATPAVVRSPNRRMPGGGRRRTTPSTAPSRSRRRTSPPRYGSPPWRSRRPGRRTTRARGSSRRRRRRSASTCSAGGELPGHERGLGGSPFCFGPTAAKSSALPAGQSDSRARGQELAAVEPAEDVYCAGVPSLYHFMIVYL